MRGVVPGVKTGCCLPSREQFRQGLSKITAYVRESILIKLIDMAKSSSMMVIAESHI